MNLRNFLLIIGIATILLFFTVNISFATSSEKITQFEKEKSNIYNYKVVTVSTVSTFNNQITIKGELISFNRSDYISVSVKNAFKNTYKIKSVLVKFSKYEDVKNQVIIKKYNKTYEFQNKDKVLLKIPNSNSSKWYNIDKITIFYNTKSSLKNESTKFQKQSSLTTTTNFKGKKVNIILKEKGRVEVPAMGKCPVITYQHFNIKTKNSKDQIQSVKIYYYDASGINNIKTLKGNKKSILNFKFYDKLEATGAGAFVVNYI